MAYDARDHHRRSLRLRGYDYAQAGWYFVTLCTRGHICLFGQIVDDAIRLNDAGRMVQAAWDQLPDRYPCVSTDAFVVMPNHIHGIIRLLPVGAGPCACPTWDADQSKETAAEQHGMERSKIGQPRGVAPTDMRLSLGDIVGRFKTLTTRGYIEGVRRYNWPAFAGRLWQRNYFEHIIRNETSLNRIRCYIADNPAQWVHDPENRAIP